MLHAQEFFTPWSQAGFQEILALPTTYGWAFDGSKAGFILLQLTDGAGEILTLQVARNARQMGLGSLLLSQAITAAHQAAAQHLFLEVAASRQAAQNLYKKHEFVITSRRKGYYKTATAREDALIMTRVLGDQGSIGIGQED